MCFDSERGKGKSERREREKSWRRVEWLVRLEVRLEGKLCRGVGEVLNFRARESEWGLRRDVRRGCRARPLRLRDGLGRAEVGRDD